MQQRKEFNILESNIAVLSQKWCLYCATSIQIYNVFFFVIVVLFPCLLCVAAAHKTRKLETQCLLALQCMNDAEKKTSQTFSHSCVE